MRLPYLWLVLPLACTTPTGDAAEPAPLPKTAAGWSIELIAQTPRPPYWKHPRAPSFWPRIPWT